MRFDLGRAGPGTNYPRANACQRHRPGQDDDEPHDPEGVLLLEHRENGFAHDLPEDEQQDADSDAAQPASLPQNLERLRIHDPLFPSALRSIHNLSVLAAPIQASRLSS